MKTIYLFTVLSFVIISNSFSASLIVREDGYQGAYASIQSAIDAANEGDSIIVFDRYSGHPWEENITIDKNIILANGVDSLRIKISGDITIQPSTDRNITFLGINLGGLFKSSGNGTSPSNRAIINIIDCNSSGVEMGYDNLDVNVIQCIIYSGVRIRHGAVLGSDVGAIRVNKESNNLSANDTIIIIGNRILNGNGFSNSLILFDSFEYCLICNNLFSISPNFTGITVDNLNTTGICNNLILNNSFKCNPYNAPSRAALELNNISSNTIIANNIADRASGNSYIVFATGYPLAFPIFAYNSWNEGYNYFPSNGHFNYSNEIIAEFDDWGRCSNCVDKGYYPGEFSDIDLTRNDLGTYGGTYSINNYQPALSPDMGKGRIHFLNMPRKIDNISTPINIRAGAHIIH